MCQNQGPYNRLNDAVIILFPLDLALLSKGVSIQLDSDKHHQNQTTFREKMYKNPRHWGFRNMNFRYFLQFLPFWQILPKIQACSENAESVENSQISYMHSDEKKLKV